MRFKSLDFSNTNKIQIRKVQPFSKEELTPMSGYIVSARNENVFKPDFDIDHLHFEIIGGKRFCRNFKFPVYSESEAGCAKYLLETSNVNTCESISHVSPLTIKSNCEQTENLYSSFYRNYPVDIVCNGALLESLDMPSGVNKIETECRVLSGPLVLQPQLKQLAEAKYLVTKIESTPFSGWNTNLIVIIILAVAVFMTLILSNACLIVCLVCPNFARKTWRCKCCICANRLGSSKVGTPNLGTPTLERNPLALQATPYRVASRKTANRPEIYPGCMIDGMEARFNQDDLDYQAYIAFRRKYGDVALQAK